MKFIPHSRPTLGPEEMAAVADVIESSQIAQGKVVYEFEKAFAQKIGTTYAVSTNSGTAALHLTLLAMEVGENDEVIIPSYVCTALLNAVRYTGAEPVLAEIDPDTYNLEPDDVRRKLTSRTKAVVVPHLFGLPADMEGLLDLNVSIIEDCAQAVGSTYRQKCVGTFGKAAVFSFYATKVMTTGEGGMVVSASKDFMDRVRDLREYDNRDEYKIRYNYKMTDIHAGIGLAQLSRLETFIQRRRIIAKLYDQAFESLELQLPPRKQGHIYFRYVIGLGTDAGPWIQNLKEKGVGCARPVYLPLHQYLGLEGFYQTEKAWRESLSIPIYPLLSEADAHRVINGLINTYKERKK
ncbi:MAG: DegT/DnrJ/EryC1/StrS family aminotransferase [Desulfobacterales bacterium]|uniref:DegT/DnrJ/EryC1/StrS family aminotransferase n=1 Tax=Candidatus Desulfatibia profunda TaxID=2841695 RepID=A0A8J6NUZ9_9BACT|nr:DegT/DnrJ/EryC1/StrS family aminotransferase [Candidatus Desulfatibia profunda]MBL7180820.1 DegT/DnrJ/EryC1/StrS family aminotransferase [Desulfobacterales bacterium]